MFQIKKENFEVELQAATDNKWLYYHRGLWKDAEKKKEMPVAMAGCIFKTHS